MLEVRQLIRKVPLQKLHSGAVRKQWREFRGKSHTSAAKPPLSPPTSS